MKITIKDIEIFKNTYGGKCARCSEPVDNVLLDKRDSNKLSGYFRCINHNPAGDEYNSKFYYKLDEKEMFVFKCL